MNIICFHDLTQGWRLEDATQYFAVVAPRLVAEEAIWPSGRRSRLGS